MYPTPNPNASSNNSFLNKPLESLADARNTIQSYLPTNQLGTAYETASQSATNAWNEFTNKEQVSPAGIFGQEETTPGFLNTNGIVAKFVFVFFVTLVFLILFQMALRIIARVYSPPRDVMLVDGLVSGSARLRIKQSPTGTSSTPILRSNNEDTGMEFTWGIWIYIDPDEASPESVYQHVFSKGDTVRETVEGILAPNNAPGLYIKSTGGASQMRVYLDDVTEHPSFIELPNIPLRKWVHVAIFLKNMHMDIYINGTITARKKMAAVPKQNYGDVLVGHTKFRGNISNLSYYDSAIDILQLQNIVQKGPNTNVVASIGSKSIDYLSRLWYANQW